jgi:hypothetical protein
MNPAELQAILWSAATTLIGPTMVASLSVMLTVRWIGGQRLGSLATVLAVAASVFVGGYYVSNAVSDERPWELDKDVPWKADELRRALALTLEEKPKIDSIAETASDEPPVDDPPNRRMPHYFLGYVAGLAMLVEFLLPLLAVPAGPAWAIRTCIALFAGRLFCHGGLRMLHPWIPWALGLLILLEWSLLTALARRWLDGVVVTALGFSCAAGCLVVQFIAHLDSLFYLGLLFASSLAGPALITWKWQGDTSPAAAAVAVTLPSMLMAGYSLTSPEPPMDSFLAAGLAPLALLPFWLPFLGRRERWARWLPGLILPLIPAILAAVWAMQHQPPAAEGW